MSGADDEPSSRYEVLVKIAAGGMATVYVGRLRGAVGFSRLVAIKRPHSFVLGDPMVRAGFGHEAHVAALIHHPHVVSVLDVELKNQRVDLILDYVEGATLADLLGHAERAGTPVSARVALRVVLDVASGLHAAHTLRGHGGAPLRIIHRDVSPQNILVGLDGQARLTDFGIAKIATDLEHTATNILKGKLGFLPPEYVEKRAFDARSDEYALAVVIWEALAARRLFKGRSDADTLNNILAGNPPSLSAVRPELAPLDDVLARGLARIPLDRFDSVASFADALEDRARRYAWVAGYGEVASAVEAAVGARIRERRSLLESSQPRPLADLSNEAAQAVSARDDEPTVPLPVPARRGHAV